jgi:hypothetical protein
MEPQVYNMGTDNLRGEKLAELIGLLSALETQRVATIDSRLVVSEQSALRKTPSSLSRVQVLLLDGIRYAAEMADIAYERLRSALLKITDMRPNEATTRDIARAMLDAWSIVDSVNRFRDLIREGGFPRDVWYNRLMRGTSAVDNLRNEVQHLVARRENSAPSSRVAPKIEGRRTRVVRFGGNGYQAGSEP